MLRDIRSGDDPQVQAVLAVIAAVDADILLLQGIDHDPGGATLAALAEALAQAGAPYPHRFAARPNTGLRTGLDHDGDGRTTGPADAQGFGRFAGQGGMAVLSRLPIDTGAVRDFSGLLWADLPGATLPRSNGALFPGDAVYAVQRLASVALWDVPVKAGAAVLHLLAFHAAPPVFDGPEDRNGLRNADELRLWPLYMDGTLPGFAPPAGPVVVLGDANNDPVKGEGRHEAIVALITDPRLQDPLPQSAPGGADTVDWPAPGPGRLRVDYVLPSAGLRVLAAGVFWPETGPMAERAATASRHRLVWVEVDLPG